LNEFNQQAHRDQPNDHPPGAAWIGDQPKYGQGGEGRRDLDLPPKAGQIHVAAAGGGQRQNQHNEATAPEGLSKHRKILAQYFVLPKSPTCTTRRLTMRIETLAVHAGYTPEPTTKAVAVPIYQTVAYSFDNAQHGADLEQALAAS
jgi:hypothetical protein